MAVTYASDEEMQEYCKRADWSAWARLCKFVEQQGGIDGGRLPPGFQELLKDTPAPVRRRLRLVYWMHGLRVRGGRASRWYLLVHKDWHERFLEAQKERWYTPVPSDCQK